MRAKSDWSHLNSDQEKKSFLQTWTGEEAVSHTFRVLLIQTEQKTEVADPCHNHFATFQNTYHTLITGLATTLFAKELQIYKLIRGKLPTNTPGLETMKNRKLLYKLNQCYYKHIMVVSKGKSTCAVKEEHASGNPLWYTVWGVRRQPLRLRYGCSSHVFSLYSAVPDGQEYHIPVCKLIRVKIQRNENLTFLWECKRSLNALILPVRREHSQGFPCTLGKAKQKQQLCPAWIC